MLASITVIGTVLGYLFYTSLADNLEYYLTPAEVREEPERWEGKRFRIAGKVEEGSIFHKPGTLDHAFTITHEGASIPVLFKGPAPDGFSEQAEVIVTGRLASEGYFEADGLLAKCPSKYEGTTK